MSAEFVDHALSALTSTLARGEMGWVAGWRYASFLEDARPLPLLLDDGAHHVLRARIVFPAKGRSGTVLLALPVLRDMDGRPARGRSQAMPGGLAGGSGAAQGAGLAGGLSAGLPADSAAGWTTALRGAVLAAPAELDAVLARVQLSIGQVMAFAPGTRIALTGADVADVTLEATVAPDAPKLSVAKGRLGQCRGFRTLRLHPPEEG